VAAIEQARIEVLFQLLDLERNGRLSHEKDFCRLGERQLLGDGMEYLQPAISHGTVLSGNLSLVQCDIQSQIPHIRLLDAQLISAPPDLKGRRNSFMV
jgi:hypothetical protein